MGTYSFRGKHLITRNSDDIMRKSEIVILVTMSLNDVVEYITINVSAEIQD